MRKSPDMKKSRKNLPKIVEMYLRKFCKKKMKSKDSGKRLKIQKNCLQRLVKRLKYRVKNAKNWIRSTEISYDREKNLQSMCQILIKNVSVWTARKKAMRKRQRSRWIICGKSMNSLTITRKNFVMRHWQIWHWWRKRFRNLRMRSESLVRSMSMQLRITKMYLSVIHS